jgi:hypothetical protein
LASLIPLAVGTKADELFGSIALATVGGTIAGTLGALFRGAGDDPGAGREDGPPAPEECGGCTGCGRSVESDFSLNGSSSLTAVLLPLPTSC